MPLPVVDMLPGIEMPRPVVRPRSQFGLPNDRFLFLFAFDMSSIFERKNPLAVIEAFRRAFRPSEPVSLAIKVSRGWTDMDNLSRLVNACLASGVHLIDDTLPREDALGLMNCCDAYVSLHRSEGFGLTLAEAMALGKPTIATGYSGNLDFMTPNNSLLVEHRLVPLTQTYCYYTRGCRWAEPNIEHAAEQMRWVFDHPDSAQALARRGQEDVRQRLSLESAGRRMVARLSELGFVPETVERERVSTFSDLATLE